MLNFLPATDFAVVDFEGLYFECFEQAAAVHEVEGTHKSAEPVSKLMRKGCEVEPIDNEPVQIELSFHIVKGTDPLCLAAATVDRVANVEVAVR